MSKLFGLGLAALLLCACDSNGVCTGKQAFEQDTCTERKKSDCTSPSIGEPGTFHEFVVEPGDNASAAVAKTCESLGYTRSGSVYVKGAPGEAKK